MARPCPVCRRFSCREEWLEGLLRKEEAAVDEWTSTERVWGEDALGRRILVYAPGDPIPEEEAKRQGLTGKKAKEKPPATKAVESPPATKATRTPQGPPRRSTRKRS